MLFRQRRDCGYLVVVIISSDGVQYSLVDYAGKLIDRFSEERSHDPAGAERFIASIKQGLARILSRSKLPQEKVLLISISSKGLVHPTDPVLVWSPIFGSNQIDFESALRPDWQARIFLGNETQLVAAALGAHEANARPVDFRSLAALSLGHSVGLGIVRSTGQGEREVSAPNFGHMLHMANGGLCRCGSRGCIEAYAGFYAILRMAFEVPLDTIPAKFVPVAELDKIAAQARQGHRMSAFAFRQAGIALGNGLSRLLSLTERMPIAITGPGTRYYDLLRPGIEDGLGQTHVVRMEGMPEIRVVPDESILVFEGHLDRALSVIDQELVLSGIQGSD